MTAEQRVAAIAAMSSVERKSEWHHRMGLAAPAAFGAGLLGRALAHDVQVKALGGRLTRAELRRLAQLNSKGRPGLQQLLADVRSGVVGVVVVYKVDRLIRSLADFAKIVDVLDEAGASFVSVAGL